MLAFQPLEDALTEMRSLLHNNRDVHKIQYCNGGLEEELLFLTDNFDSEMAKRSLSLFSDNRNELA